MDTYSVHGIYRGCHIIWKWVKIGVITNLRISEFDLRHEEDDNIVIIPCVHHKTGAQAMAQLAVTIDIEEILIFYFNNIHSGIETKDIHKDKLLVISL